MKLDIPLKSFMIDSILNLVALSFSKYKMKSLLKIHIP